MKAFKFKGKCTLKTTSSDLKKAIKYGLTPSFVFIPYSLWKFYKEHGIMGSIKLGENDYILVETNPENRRYGLVTRNELEDLKGRIKNFDENKIVPVDIIHHIVILNFLLFVSSDAIWKLGAYKYPHGHGRFYSGDEKYKPKHRWGDAYFNIGYNPGYSSLPKNVTPISVKELWGEQYNNLIAAGFLYYPIWQLLTDNFKNNLDFLDINVAEKLYIRVKPEGEGENFLKKMDLDKVKNIEFIKDDSLKSEDIKIEIPISLLSNNAILKDVNGEINGEAYEVFFKMLADYVGTTKDEWGYWFACCDVRELYLFFKLELSGEQHVEEITQNYITGNRFNWVKAVADKLSYGITIVSRDSRGYKSWKVSFLKSKLSYQERFGVKFLQKFPWGSNNLSFHKLLTCRGRNVVLRPIEGGDIYWGKGFGIFRLGYNAKQVIKNGVIVDISTYSALKRGGCTIVWGSHITQYTPCSLGIFYSWDSFGRKFAGVLGCPRICPELVKGEYPYFYRAAFDPYVKDKKELPKFYYRYYRYKYVEASLHGECFVPGGWVDYLYKDTIGEILWKINKVIYEYIDKVKGKISGWNIDDDTNEYYINNLTGIGYNNWCMVDTIPPLYEKKAIEGCKKLESLSKKELREIELEVGLLNRLRKKLFGGYLGGGSITVVGTPGYFTDEGLSDVYVAFISDGGVEISGNSDIYEQIDIDFNDIEI